MKSLVIYTSQTGFTRKYAMWLADRLNADILDLKDAKKKEKDYFNDYQAIIYGGWAMAGNIVKLKWFLENASTWKDKRLAVFCVGGSPNDNPDIDVTLHNMLTDEQRNYIRAFYCQGGFNYEKMNGPSKLAMKMFISTLKKKKDATEEEKKMVEVMSSSYDISDIKFIEPIVDYLEREANS